MIWEDFGRSWEESGSAGSNIVTMEKQTVRPKDDMAPIANNDDHRPSQLFPRVTIFEKKEAIYSHRPQQFSRTRGQKLLKITESLFTVRDKHRSI